MNKDVKELWRKLERLGYQVRIRPSGHAHIHNPDGQRIISMSTTPKHGPNAAIRDLRRAGVPI